MAHKVHLNQTQFDDWLHAACGALSAPPEDPRILEDERAFEALPYERRCRKCAAWWWPHGHEPRLLPHPQKDEG